MPTENQLAQLMQIIHGHERGLIICGPGCPAGGFPAAVATLANATGYPIFADPLSGVRFGVAAETAVVVGGYESFLRGGKAPWPAPKVVLRFGAVPTSKWLNSYLAHQPPPHLIHVRDNGIWADDLHLVTHFLQADAAQTCEQLAMRISGRTRSAWTAQIFAVETTSQQIVQRYCHEHFFDGAVVNAIVNMLPAGSRLLVGNSLPVRHLDQFGLPNARPLQIFGNRGASGIDGITSTALGIAAASGAPLVLVTGDISFYHDLNGLLAIRQQELQNVTIVLLNNNGGSIFRRLPIAQFEPPFAELFLTPHGLDFRHAAQFYGVDYVRCNDYVAFCETFKQSVAGNRATIIEVQTDGAADQQHQRAVTELVLESSAIAVNG